MDNFTRGILLIKKKYVFKQSKQYEKRINKRTVAFGGRSNFCTNVMLYII